MICCGFGSARPTKTACCVRPVRGLISEKLFAMKLRGSPWSSFGHLPSCCAVRAVYCRPASGRKRGGWWSRGGSNS